MNKRIFAFLAMLFLLPAIAWATGDSESASRDRVGYLGSGTEKGSYVLRVSSTGHVFSGFDKRNELGTPTKRWGNVFSSSQVITDQLKVSSGILNVHEYFSDIPTASTTIYTNSGITVSTTNILTVSVTSITANFSSQGDFPRNVVIVSSFSTGNATSTVVGSAIFTGVDVFGLIRNETISFSTNTGTGSVAFASISSVTITASAISGTSIGSMQIYIGTGNKIGLSAKVQAATDIYKILEANADVVIANVTLDTTNNTITFASAPNAARDYNVWIKPTISSPKN